MTEKTTKPGSFAAMLASIRPSTDGELAENLTQLIEAVKTTGKKGTLTLTFEVKPADGASSAVVVNDRITKKFPERTREGSLAFIDRDNRLSRTDPSAMPLFDNEDIREPAADPHTGEIRSLNDE